ncbi:aspartic proteinase nepenthesin-1-like [Ananas comosus]|uniref:Aspartic proteinase nepenthesin-1-like n=1 Tax=Ananas comosus TaxID=4615 RepID=A0A6P5H216_ANACO|nr:aspartic proteinase nepenthesin-1-like [Ananas comosus]
MAGALYNLFLAMYFLLASSIIQSLQLRMIHRDSILSPLYPGNLTAEEHMDRLYNYTILRAETIESRMSSPVINYNATRIQPRLHVSFFLYVLELAIGTPWRAQAPRQPRYLMMDTASSLMWLQCLPCARCWSPPHLVFDRRRSRSFAPIPCNHPLCDLRNPEVFRCVNRQCHYTYRYADPALTRGILATETLSLGSDRGGFKLVHNFIFGCSHDNRNFNNLGTQVQGIAGFNRRSASFLGQMNQLAQAHGKFAYCLQREINRPSVLKFGEHAELRGPNVKTVPILHLHNEIDYFVSLVDVSVANHRIGFPPGTFRERIEHGVIKGGFVIDSGAAAANFNGGGPYERVKNTFEEYFQRFGLAHHHHHRFEVCYNIPHGGFTAYPSMTFHFENGNDFVAPPENVVVFVEQNYFCVMIVKSNVVNTLGAHLQRNYRMSFDIQRETFSYIPADCGRDA